MIKASISIIFILMFISNLLGQDSIYVNEKIVVNNRSGFSGEGGISYEFTSQNVFSYVGDKTLEFRQNLQYIGWEQSYSPGWVQGPTAGISIHGLLGGSDVLENEKYKLKGFRAGIRLGYKFRFWKLLVIEPNGTVQYGNLRIREKATNNKIITNGLNLGTNLDTKFIIKMRDFQDIQIGFSFGYLFDVVPHSWYDAKKSNGSITADQINWSGWYFGIKLLFIDAG